jgi:hypothetical protein
VISSSDIFQLQLIVREAETRLRDGDRLQSDLADPTDSGYLLQLLGFELLLKACLTATGQPLARKHSYVELWSTLPSDTQRELLEAAQMRMAGIANYSNLPELLHTWSKNFVSLRYPYEKYTGMSEADYRARGEVWLACGAKESDADFVYYPNELRGLIDAMLTYLQHQIARNAPTA